ncbi:MAG TPA: DUF559 domain-containing protein [Chloroflexia bacterium]|nr:DUF559 domain-containing protein [Chloroflexia bacterium]
MTTSQPVVTRSNSAHVSSQPKAFKKTGILYEDLYADSYLEYLFLRWVLTPLTRYEIIDRISPQCEVRVSGKQYQIDYAFIGQERRFVVELDGYTEHSNKYAFTRDRSRDNDLLVDGWDVLRFSFDAVQEQTGNCIFQLQGAFSKDPLLRTFLIDKPQVTRPDYTDEEWEKIKSYKINCCIRNPLNLKLFNPGPSREELVLQLANLQVEQERLTTEFASELNTTTAVSKVIEPMKNNHNV